MRTSKSVYLLTIVLFVLWLVGFWCSPLPVYLSPVPQYKRLRFLLDFKASCLQYDTFNRWTQKESFFTASGRLKGR
ncbi:MAG: hypothetical protein LH647_13090 [Leptolyngbyaceae cyanobacterium CAN_BIN12]|nr:hypothetical protein [Leptolyngbyaceae cyanobacterium CAN_BIN12]